MNTLKGLLRKMMPVRAADSHIGAWVGHYLPVLVGYEKWKQEIKTKSKYTYSEKPM